MTWRNRFPFLSGSFLARGAGGLGASQSPSSVTATAAGTLTGSTGYWRISAAAPLTLSTTTPIAAGSSDGQILTIENVGHSEVAFPCAYGSNYRHPSFLQRVLYPGQSATLRWSSSDSLWRGSWERPTFWDLTGELKALAAGGTHNFLTTAALGPWAYTLVSGTAPTTLTASASGIAYVCGASTNETTLIRSLLLDLPLSRINAVNFTGQINATGSNYGGDSYYQTTLRDLSAAQEVGASFLVGNGAGFQYGNLTYSSDAVETIAGVNDNWVSAARAVNWRSIHKHNGHALLTDSAAANAVVPLDIDASTTQANWPVEAGSTVAVRVRFINTATGAAAAAKTYSIPLLSLSLG